MKKLSKQEIDLINGFLTSYDPDHGSIHGVAYGIADIVDDYICNPKESPMSIPLEIIVDAVYLLRNA